VEGAFCDPASASPHVDVLWVKPTRRDPHQHLVTAGMSAKRMKVPRRRSIPDRVELVLTLPAGWPIGPGSVDGEQGWPMRELMRAAAIPHETRRYMGLGHVIGRYPPEPFTEDTELSGWVLTPPDHLAPAFRELDGGGKRTAFFSLVAVHAGEVEFSWCRQPEDLLARLAAAGVSAVLDLQRPSTVPGISFGGR
jgi:hypothetical protein